MKPLSNRNGAPATLRARFQYADRRLLLARARLLADRVELDGWGWRGRHRRTVPLEELVRVDWIPERSDGVNLGLHLRGGGALQLRIAGAGLWKYEIESRVEHLRRTSKPPAPARTSERYRKAG